MRAVVVVLLSVFGLAFAVAPASASSGCDAGELCLWSDTSYRGPVVKMSLSDTNPGECVPVGAEARSFANLLSRPVTVYQSAECATEGEFDTYPGRGTYVPCAPFVVRGVQLWST